MKIRVQLKIMVILSFAVWFSMLVGLFSIWLISDWYRTKQGLLNEIESSIQQALSSAFVETRYHNDHGKAFDVSITNVIEHLDQFSIRNVEIITQVNINSSRVQRIKTLFERLETIAHSHHAFDPGALSHLEDKLFSEFILLQSDTNVLRYSVDQYFKEIFYKGAYSIFLAIFLITLIPVWINLRISQRISVRLKELMSVTFQIRKGNFSARVGLDSDDELGLISRAMDNMLEDIESLTVTRNELESIVKERTEELEKQAMRDSLTGILNRRALMSNTAVEVTRSQRHNSPLSLLFLDLDHFKKINDQYGHRTGDDVLIELCRLLESLLRESDILARYGGEEFAVLCVETDVHHALLLSKRILEAVEKHFSEHEKLSVGLTVSIGIAQLSVNDNLTTFFSRADVALYRAKANGRNNAQIERDG